MSTWGTLDATFREQERSYPAEEIAERIRLELEQREILAPTGSEDGPSVHASEHGEVWVEGRLRDVSDLEDSPMILAWFIHHTRRLNEATLTWDIDGGPRYRWEYKDGTLTKLKGILD